MPFCFVRPEVCFYKVLAADMNLFFFWGGGRVKRPCGPSTHLWRRSTLRVTAWHAFSNCTAQRTWRRDRLGDGDEVGDLYLVGIVLGVGVAFGFGKVSGPMDCVFGKSFLKKIVCQIYCLSSSFPSFKRDWVWIILGFVFALGANRQRSGRLFFISRNKQN